MNWEPEQDDEEPCDPDDTISETQLADILGLEMWEAASKLRRGKVNIVPTYSIHGRLLYDPVQVVNAMIDARMFVTGNELARIVDVSEVDMALKVTSRYRATLAKRKGYKAFRLDDSLTQFFVRREFGKGAQELIWAEIKTRRLEILYLFDKKRKLPTTFSDEWMRERA